MNARALLVGSVLLWPTSSAAAQVSEPSPAASPAPPQAVVATDEGEFVIQLLPDLAPRHAAHFVKTAKARGYDGTTFHRVVPRGIIQGGDPLSKDPAKKRLYGTGGLGLLRAEFSPRPMTRGSVAAVLRPSSIHSAGNQFFICLSDQLALTGRFTIFGEVVSGMEVLDRLADVPVTKETPLKRIVIRKVTLREAAATANP